MPIYKLEGCDIKQISLRLTDEQFQKLNDLIEKVCDKTFKNGDSMSDKLRLFIDKLYDTLIEKLVEGETVSSEMVNPSSHSQQAQNECIYRVSDNRCSRFFLKKAKIVTVDPDFCNHCWELQQKLKTSLPLSQTSTSNIYKKPDKIFCLKDYLWLDPLKYQAKCENCKLKDFYKWSDCQRNQSAKKRMEA